MAYNAPVHTAWQALSRQVKYVQARVIAQEHEFQIPVLIQITDGISVAGTEQDLQPELNRKHT